MEEKDLKVLLEELGQKTDAKLKEYSEEIKKGLYSKETIDKLKAELEADVKKYNDLSEKQQEQLDAIDTKLGKLVDIGTKATSTYDMFKKAFTDDNAVQKYLEHKNWSKSFDRNLFMKVDDMTGANSYESTDVVGDDRRGGIFYDPANPFSVRSILPVVPTSLNSTSYVYEYAESDNTAVTSEGAEYKQGDFDLKVGTATVYKVTNYIMLSDEMLEDVDGIQAYIMSRLPDRLRIKENYYVLYGTGSSMPTGITVGATAWSDTLADSKVQRIDILHAAVTQLRTAYYQPNAILLNPADAQKIRLTKTESDYQYFNLQWVIGGTNPMIAGVPVIESADVTSGDFIVGDFRKAATIRERKGSTIEMTNQNENNFIKGMVTVRGSYRIAVENHNPSAVVYDTFTAALAKGSA